MRGLGLMVLCCATHAASAVFAQPAPSQMAETARMIQQLKSADPSARGAAKLELMRAANPEVLPALLELAAGAKGELRTNLLEILSVYKDPRKIPTLIPDVSAI